MLSAPNGISALTTVLRYTVMVNGSVDTEELATVLDGIDDVVTLEGLLAAEGKAPDADAACLALGSAARR